MTKQELINNSTFIIFPNKQLQYNKEYINYLSEIETDRYVFLPYIDMRYSKLKGNAHHYTTQYSKNYVLPSIDKLLNINLNINDFKLVKNIVKGNDLSFLEPRKTVVYHYIDFLHEIEIKHCHYKQLGDKLIQQNNDIWTTPYHHLFTSSHSCCRIINKTNQNGRKILISGDSQIVPTLRPLTYYFEELWYYDNRTDKKIEETYLNTTFTDVLFQFYSSPISRYFNTNLK